MSSDPVPIEPAQEAVVQEEPSKDDVPEPADQPDPIPLPPVEVKPPVEEPTKITKPATPAAKLKKKKQIILELDSDSDDEHVTLRVPRKQTAQTTRPTIQAFNRRGHIAEVASGWPLGSSFNF